MNIIKTAIEQTWNMLIEGNMELRKMFYQKIQSIF